MELKNLKIFFMGTSYFSAQIIEDLVSKGVPISTVVTQPDRPVGRKKEIAPPEAKKIAIKHNLLIKQFEKIDNEAMDFFQLENPDLIIVAAYGLILPQELLDLPKFGCINIHTSLLPELRGPSPIQTALLKGFKKTGVSIMKMDKEIDHGPILSQKEIPISKSDNYISLEKKMTEASNEILLPTLQKTLSGELIPKEQEHHKATFTKIISKEDGEIIWSNSASQIEDLFKAFCVWPKVFCYWGKNKQMDYPLQKIIFWELEAVEEVPDSASKQYGEVFKSEDGRILIKTGAGLILPKKLQIPGKNAMEIKEFCNGQPQFVGSVLN